MALSSPPTELLKATALRMSAIPTLVLVGGSSLAFALPFAGGVSSEAAAMVAASAASVNSADTAVSVSTDVSVGFRALVFFLAMLRCTDS